MIGVLIARPAQASGGELLVDLLPGRTYAIVCQFRDGEAVDSPMRLAHLDRQDGGAPAYWFPRAVFPLRIRSLGTMEEQ